jgi:hypothetical protein
MPRLQRDADLAVGLEAADAGAVPGAGIDDHERAASASVATPAGGGIAREGS